jgi:Fur family transcriptional regulator, stress-responsive regulator
MTDAIDTRAALRAAGLRVTEQRLATLAVLDDDTARGTHLTTEDVHARVAVALPGTPLQSVYLVLGALTAAGLVRRIEPAGSPARYERRIGDNHHHVVCTVCGAIEDVDCVVGHAPCLTPSDAHGFTVTTAEVTFWGMCASCREQEADAAPPIDQPE